MAQSDSQSGGLIWLLEALSIEDVEGKVFSQAFRTELENLSDESFQEILNHLTDADNSTRKTVAVALGASGSIYALHPLIDASLHEPSKQIDAEITRAIQQIKTKPNIRSVALAWGTPNQEQKLLVEGHRILSNLDPLWVQSELFDLLKDPNDHIRIGSAHLLTHIGDRTSAEPLVEAINDTNPAVRVAALIALGAIAPEQHIDVFFKALEDSSKENRLYATLILSKIQNNFYEKLFAIITDRESRGRVAAVSLLGRNPIRESNRYSSLTTLLLNSLDDDDTEFADEAAITLGKLKTPGAFAKLIELLRTRTDKSKIMMALGYLGDPRATPRLVLKLRSEEWKRDAIEALLLLDDPNTIQPLLDTIRQYYDYPKVRSPIFEFIKRHAEAAQQILIANLENKNPHVREFVVELLGEMGEPSIINQLQDMVLHDKNSLVKRQAAIAIEKLSKIF